MEVRTYYANTVEAAFALARREFGAEAMLMQSNRAAPGLDHRGAYEVVFAGEPVEEVAVPTAWDAPTVLWPAHIRDAPDISINGLVRPSRVSAGEIAFGPVDLLRGRPVAVTVPGPLPSFKRLNTHTQTVKKNPAARPFLNVVCNPGLNRFASSSYTVALVGPTGSGKTTTAMKLAVQYGLLSSRPCRMIAFDPDRVGMTERLRHFSNLLRVPFESFENPGPLSEAINRQAPGLTIIDTPGCARADDHVLASLAFLLGSHADLETQLVLRADRRLADNITAAARLSALKPKRLIVTAVDETSDYGELDALVVALALPLSFLGTGQRIPDDLEPASRPRLEGLVKHGWSRTSAAAA